MRWLGDVIHILTGGLILAFAWMAAGVVCFPFPETRSLSAPCFRVALFYLWPHGRELVREAQITAYREYLRTGQPPDRAATEIAANRRAARAQVAAWAPLGLTLASAHVIHGLITVFLLSPPWRSPSFSVLPVCCFPRGWRAARLCEARTRLFLAPGQRLSKPAYGSTLGSSARAARRLRASLFGAAIVLSASVLVDEPLLINSATSLDRLDIAGSPAYRSARPFTGTAVRIARPQAMPPLPIGGISHFKDGEPDCGTPAAEVLFPGLSRRHPTFALPLGSRQIALRPDRSQTVPLERLRKLHHLAASVRYARDSRPTCFGAVSAYAIRSAHYAADRATFVRLSHKVVSRNFVRSRDNLSGFQNSMVQQRRVMKVQLLLNSTSPAKAPNVSGVDEIATKIAKVGSIR